MERGVEKKTTPPRETELERDPEALFFEDPYEPYFDDAPRRVERPEGQAPGQRKDTPVELDEEWLWREPESTWSDEDIWPWPGNFMKRPEED